MNSHSVHNRFSTNASVIKIWNSTTSVEFHHIRIAFHTILIFWNHSNSVLSRSQFRTFCKFRIEAGFYFLHNPVISIQLEFYRCNSVIIFCKTTHIKVFIRLNKSFRSRILDFNSWLIKFLVQRNYP